MRRRRIVLTHWNAGVFDSESLPHLLPELVVYGLLYDEVLIREEDLFTNRQITHLLSDPENLRFFEEMLVSGPVRLLRLPLTAYPPGRKFDPERLPVSARVEEHQLRRTYKGAPWKPTRQEWRLFERLDRVVRDHRSTWDFHAEFPPENKFALQLARVLEQRHSYSQSAHPFLKKIEPGTADAFIAFCREPGAWQRFLYDHGVRSFIEGPDGQFFRSAAYQCSKLLPNPVRMQRLVESAYAATFCNRERSEGRYGGKLIELPYRFATADEASDAAETLIRVEAAPTGAVAQVPIMPGVADVLARTRESKAFDDLRRVLVQLGKHHPPMEGEFRAAWLNVSEVYTRALLPLLACGHPPARPMLAYSFCAYITALVVGFFVIPNGPTLSDANSIINHAIELYGPHLLRSFRGLGRAPDVRKHLGDAVEIRCSQVPLDTAAEDH